MIRIIILTFILCTCSSCTQQNKQPVVNNIWVEDAQVPKDLTTPEGFSISPHEAYQVVLNARRLSLKHYWHIYADDSNYYIQDAFLGSRPVKGGVIVDGRTGVIKN